MGAIRSTEGSLSVSFWWLTHHPKRYCQTRKITYLVHGSADWQYVLGLVDVFVLFLVGREVPGWADLCICGQ